MTGFLAWLRSHEITELFFIAAAAAGLLAFAAATGDSLDRSILLSLRHPGDLTPIGSHTLVESARDISALGSLLLLALFTLIAAGLLALEGQSRLALAACGWVAGAQVASNLLKLFFHRARPEIVPHEAYFSGASFPSGHAMMSAATYLTLAALVARGYGSNDPRVKKLRAYCMLVAGFLTLAIGVTRVYLGVHWPTDVFAGWMTGALWAMLASLSFRRIAGPDLDPNSEATR